MGHAQATAAVEPSDGTILEGLPTALVVVDADGVVVRANRRAHDVLDRDTLVGTPLAAVLGP